MYQMNNYFYDEKGLTLISEELISILKKSKAETKFSHNQIAKIIKLKAEINEMSFCLKSEGISTTYISHDPAVNKRVWLDLYSYCEEVANKGEQNP